MALEQRLEQSEELLEINEENKERVEDARDHVRQAGNRVNAAQAQLQYAYSQLQQARAERDAAAQRASQEEDGYVSSSYDAAVSDAMAEVNAAEWEVQDARREQMEADRELRNAEGDLAESSRELRSVAEELQQVSEKYGLNLGMTSQLMNLPYSQLASPLMQQLGIGKDQVDDLRQRIATSLGIGMVATGSGYGGGFGGYSSGNRSRAAGGGGSISSGGSSGGTSGASGGSYTSRYVKTSYNHPVTYTHPQTKQRITKMSNRTVYQNRDLDPNMVVPAGTRRANGTVVRRTTTNQELMRKGQAPFIPQRLSDGSTVLAQVELHHLSGEETQHGSQFFRGEDVDGSMVEISHLTHDKYDRQLHLGTPSFRKGYRKQKSEDAAKYESFRKSYWRNRAAAFDAANGS